MHSQNIGFDPHILAIVLTVVALCAFLASCTRFFFRDIAWKSTKTRNEQMSLESERSSSRKNNNAVIGCMGILGSLLLAGVGTALLGNRSPHSPESAQMIVNGTKMYPDAPRHYRNTDKDGIAQDSKALLSFKKKGKRFTPHP